MNALPSKLPRFGENTVGLSTARIISKRADGSRE